MSRRWPSTRARTAAIAAACLFVLVFALVVIPWLVKGRTFIASTPTLRPQAALTDLRVPAGESACLRGGIVYERSARAVRFQVRTARTAPGGPPLEIEASAPGYRATARQPGGYLDTATLVVPITPAPRQVGGGSLCIRNAGRTSVGIVATTEPRQFAPIQSTLDGEPASAQPSVALIDPAEHSILSRLGTLADRISAFRPGIVGRLTLYLLGLGLVAAVPGLVVLALLRSRDADEPEPEPRRAP